MRSKEETAWVNRGFTDGKNGRDRDEPTPFGAEACRWYAEGYRVGQRLRRRKERVG